jgi:hypothetical protein
MGMVDIYTRDEFAVFLAKRQRGDSAIYHRGYLATDVGKQPLLRDLTMAIKTAAQNDQVMLFQYKMGEFQYEYRVIKT